MNKKFKFYIFSLLGILGFLCPITLGGETTILISHFAGFMQNNYHQLVLLITVISALITIVGTISWTITHDLKNNFLNELFSGSKLDLVLRILGSILYLIVLFKVAPEFLLSPDTGGTTLDLVSTLYLTFFAGIILMPFITRFGLVEFIGALVAPFMRKLFKVPGYAAIDAMASFVGDGTIGIVVTDSQYQKGYYTQREAALIASTFSIVGISFAGAVAQELGFGSIFGFFYGTIFVVTVIVALIMARLPMKKFKNEYYDKPASNNTANNQKLSVKEALELAYSAADETKISDAFIGALKSIVSIYITFIPIIMFVGTTGLVIANYTSIIDIIAMPLIPLLKIIGFAPDVAKDVAPSLFVGFADMYLPTIFIADSASEFAKFFVGVMSFTQLIFLSETGMILVKSKIGYNFIDVVKLFLLRTVIAFPFVLLFTKIIEVLGFIN